MNAQLKFPLGTETLVRKTHPVTSFDAAKHIKGSERLGDLQSQALESIQNYPGMTTHEHNLIHDLGDERTLGRRFSELRRAGLVYPSGTAVDRLTGKTCQRWWPKL